MSSLQTYRPRWGRRIPLALALIIFGLAVFGVILIPGGALFSYVWRVTMPVVSAIVILVLFLVSRPRLEISEDDLLVVNILTTRRLVWNQVIAVRFAKDAPWASLDLADGSKLNLMAVQNSDASRARAIAVEIANRCNR